VCAMERKPRPAKSAGVKRPVAPRKKRPVTAQAPTGPSDGPNDVSGRAVGRAVVSDALLAAAERLFGTKGPNAVSLREIAAEADVNFGLLYQYIGTRENLLRAVFDRVSEKGFPAFAEAPDFASAARLLRGSQNNDPYARMLAWSILEGHDLHAREAHLPPATGALLDHVRAALAERGLPDEREARATLALVYAFNLGWRLFAEHLLPAFELTEWADAMDRAVSDVLVGLPSQLSFDFLSPAPSEPPQTHSP
jgi:TetR/AcrR family transcriptional regulator, repressor for neighboring sulfatase